VTVLKLQARDGRGLSTAKLINSLEEEINGWTISKPVLAARRLQRDGTRGIRLGEVSEIRDRLIGGPYATSPYDLSRESHIAARAGHTLDRRQNLWAGLLSGD
jgi:hypothetical protein